MSIPLDRLYHYIESIAQEICDGRVIIYRFSPHGSKKIKDLNMLQAYKLVDIALNPQIICYDQEPLNYQLYADAVMIEPEYANLLMAAGLPKPQFNLRTGDGIVNIYDKDILLHSECNSSEVEVYRNNNFIPVYYWSHATIARDWFRYAKYISQTKDIKKMFLVYNRAWAGTREYRLQFANLLIQLGLQDYCQMSCNPIDPELGIHYNSHCFENSIWQPTNVIEEYFPISDAESYYSADFNLKDYEMTNIEVVLETLFDDNRLHLTEKSLRPIALGQPFILTSTSGSLEYLRRYGFKTFGQIWNEDYDLIDNSEERLVAITDLMHDIANWGAALSKHKLAQAQDIADYNKQYFFSKEFHDIIINELRTNLTAGLALLETTNTSCRYITQRKTAVNYIPLVNYITVDRPGRTRQDLANIIKAARQYYLRSLKHNS